MTFSCSQVFRIENHDQAYYLWKKLGFKNRKLIHIDAHDDLNWKSDSELITIANFLGPALLEGLIGEVFWVVPNQVGDAIQNRQAFIRYLKKLQKFSASSPPIIQEKNCISTVIFGKPLQIILLENLPQLDETILLDVDIDYFVIPRACYRFNRYPEMPWCWPADLVKKLAASRLQFDLITIAYSVEGGHTPLKWKYLGDELACRLGENGTTPDNLQGLDLMQTAAQAAYGKNFRQAELDYLKAAILLPHSPAPPFHLALLYLAMNKPALGRECYQRALSLDISYRNPYNNSGIYYSLIREYDRAEQEYQTTLALDQEDPYAHYGLAALSARRRLWREAENWLNKSLILNDRFLDAHRLLGKVLDRQGRYAEATLVYERSLKLALAGSKSLVAPVLTDPENRRIIDPDHYRVHLRLARIFELQGKIKDAIRGYRLVGLKGQEGIYPCFRLGCLYWQTGQRQKSLQAIWQLLRIAPSEVWEHCRYLFFRVKIYLFIWWFKKKTAW